MIPEATIGDFIKCLGQKSQTCHVLLAQQAIFLLFLKLGLNALDIVMSTAQLLLKSVFPNLGQLFEQASQSLNPSHTLATS